MTPIGFGDRLATGSLLGLAAFGVVAMGALQFGFALPAIALPVAVGVGVSWRSKTAAPPSAPAAPPAVALGICLLILAVVVAVGFGALATPSRHWDGAVAWDVKARFLTEGLTLDQPFFRDPNVLVHSRDYPLLQPLIVAAGDRLLGGGCGRLLFPFLCGVLALLLGVGARRAGTSGTIAWLTAAGCVLAPRLANPTSGGADSGYAELFLLVATTALAVGILVRDPRILAAGAALAVMVKPEGMVYASLAIVVCWCAGDRRRTVPVTLGWLIGALASLPVQRQLQTLESSAAWSLWLSAGGVAAFVLIADTVARRRQMGVGSRTVTVLALLPVVALALPWLVGLVAGAEAGTMSAYLADPGRALRRLERLPAILVGVMAYAMPPGAFALAFVAPLAAAVGLWSQRRRLTAPAVAAFTLSGIAAVLGAFLLSPEEDLGHHLRSSMSRLLLHWLGPVMLLAGVWSHASRAPDALPAAERGTDPS